MGVGVGWGGERRGGAAAGGRGGGGVGWGGGAGRRRIQPVSSLTVIFYSVQLFKNVYPGEIVVTKKLNRFPKYCLKMQLSFS